MSTRGAPAPALYQPHLYWEERARRFAAEGEGLAAVCSYGMPQFYNRMIHVGQRLALARWLHVAPGTRVLDVGCGVGRWSRLLAARGAHVTGIDLSPTMIEQARQRTASTGLSDLCQFEVQDLSRLELPRRYDTILGVTVLQHILDPAALRSAVQRMREHLAPHGRMVLLEAAPTEHNPRCDTSVFNARSRNTYLNLFADCGLRLRKVTGVDPAPFKIWLLPHLWRMPRKGAIAALAAATAASLPIDALFGRWAVERSWHAVFVLDAVPGETP